jgi:hypothetical protein
LDIESFNMTTLTIWLQTGEVSNSDIAAGLTDHDVAVADLGSSAMASRRTNDIRLLLNDTGKEFSRLRLIFGPAGELCTYQTSDLNDDRRYNEFDVLFSPDQTDMSALYEGLATLIGGWRRRGQPRNHRAVVPHVSPYADDEI